MRAQKRRKLAEAPVGQEDDVACISENTEISPTAPPTMEIFAIWGCYKPENDEEDAEIIFNYSKVGVKLSTGELFYTIINERVDFDWNGNTIDLGQLDISSISSKDVTPQLASILANTLALDHLDLIPIPLEAFWPKCPPSLTRAPEQKLKDGYIKLPPFLDYEADDTDQDQNHIHKLVLGEAKVCEIL
ncbi:hypothetical protein FSARC_14530, partial [Fusarium sarcochroum]